MQAQRMTLPPPSARKIQSVLAPVELERWQKAGQPVSAELAAQRRGVCEQCVDVKCRNCWRTHFYRYVETQQCPLGLWPR